MADYNVNMRQWNGTSFDNVLPLAYMANNAGKLDGKTYEQILTAANQYADNYKFVIGVYNGKAPNNSYGNYQKITLGFKPRYLIIAAGILTPSFQVTGGAPGYIGGSSLGDVSAPSYGTSYYVLRYLDDGFEVGNHAEARMILNSANSKYIYFAVP